MNFVILKICLDLRHVEIHGFEKADLDALVNVLKVKSSFFITPSPIFDINQHSEGPTMGGSFNQLSDMMKKWPRLQSLHVQRFLTLTEWSSANSLMLDMSDACGCCQTYTKTSSLATC